MNIPAAALKKMLDCGLTLADAIEVAELMKAPTKGAERQRRFREKQKAETVTGDVTCNATSDVTAPPEAKGFSAPLPKTQTSNLSEPKGSSRKLPAHTRDADFSVFWRAYPRRVAKPEALKAFGKAIAKIPHPDPLGVMLAGLERAKALWLDPKFIPHPATWLNQERWTDEPAAILQFPPTGHDNRNPPSRRQASIDASERVAEGVLERRARERRESVF